MKAYSQATDAGATVIVLDFGGLEYMNSGGIGLLVTLLVRAQRAGQRLMAVACPITTARSCRSPGWTRRSKSTTPKPRPWRPQPLEP